jgi:hypothetical protein
MGTRLFTKTPAAAANEPMEIAALANCAIRTIHTAQFFGPGMRLNISIMPSPVHTV